MKESALTGIGIDIIKIERMRILAKDPNALDKIFTPAEIKYCAKMAMPAEHFAARFAAKEAVIKAATSVGRNLKFKDIEILNSKNGNPVAIVKSKKFHSNFSLTISMSHEEEFAIAAAFVVCTTFSQNLK